MVRGGFELFWDAVMSVLVNWRAAIKIMAVPVLIAAGVGAVDQYFWTVAYDTGQDYRGFEYLSIALSIWMIGFVAGAWHRFVVLGEAPVATVPKISFDLAARYAIYWFCIGIFVAFILLGIIAIFVVILHFSETLGDDPFIENLTWAFGLVNLEIPFQSWLVGIVFVYFLFRVGLGLPDMAVDVGRLNVLRSIRRTRPFRGRIIVLALLAGTAQAPVVNYYNFLGESYFGASPAAVAVHGLISGTLWGCIALFGASILTVLYQRTGGLPVDPEQENGGGPLKG